MNATTSVTLVPSVPGRRPPAPGTLRAGPRDDETAVRLHSPGHGSAAAGHPFPHPDEAVAGGPRAAALGRDVVGHFDVHLSGTPAQQDPYRLTVVGVPDGIRQAS